MASDRNLAEYIAEQLEKFGVCRIKPMFGEFCFYLNEKPVGFLCENRLLIKTNAVMRKKYSSIPTQLLFEGAKEPMWLIDDIDNSELLRCLILCALENLPDPKQKKSNPSKSRSYRDGEGSPWNDPALFPKKRKRT